MVLVSFGPSVTGPPLIRAATPPPGGPCRFQEIGASLLRQSLAESTNRRLPLFLCVQPWMVPSLSGIAANATPPSATTNAAKPNAVPGDGLRVRIQFMAALPFAVRARQA